jgi:hypothetical protein
MLSFGFLTFPVILYAGWRLRSRATMASAAAYFLLELAFMMRPNGLNGALVAAFMILSWIGGTLHAGVLSGRLRARYRPASAATEWPTLDGDDRSERPDRALTAARRNRQLRLDARRIVEDDLALAADLRIGRPDLPRTYVDGGLIDVNHVPEQFLISELDMQPSVAQEVVRVRVQRNGFSSADDMLIACDSLNPQRLEMLRDRLIFVPRDIELAG